MRCCLLAICCGCLPVMLLGPLRAEDTTATGSALSAAEAKELVALHNAARDEVKVPAVRWSPTLAKHAQAWADELARSGKFEHRPSDGEWASRFGENIALGSGDGFDAAAGCRLWLKEREDYVADAPLSDDLSELRTGHYTQIVWRGTTHIGAGRAVLQTGEMKGWTVIVCNYDPPGNARGEKPF